MKIGVIGDTHGSATAWQLAVQGPLRDADVILHAGDLLYHGPRNPLPEGYDPGRLAELINSSPVPLIVAQGNCDSEVDQMVLNWPIQAPYAFTQFGELRIMLTHGHTIDEASREELAELYQLDLFISGHTHLPGIDRSGGCVFLNPGSPSLPKQEGAIPTVALIEDNKVSILNLTNGNRLVGLAIG